ncbi:hypothetical protein [Bradyrhizobium nanningense]|uniref:hypothetical protein n=1 Tax=Bradyrhizobium nanningense TaxID=1325118 RepID=UPI0013E8E4A5|nr:hypothetical protein [Bradyrhizobium nanningense]
MDAAKKAPISNSAREQLILDGRLHWSMCLLNGGGPRKRMVALICAIIGRILDGSSTGNITRRQLSIGDQRGRDSRAIAQPQSPKCRQMLRSGCGQLG